jgi:hypothetical protein
MYQFSCSVGVETGLQLEREIQIESKFSKLKQTGMKAVATFQKPLIEAGEGRENTALKKIFGPKE